MSISAAHLVRFRAAQLASMGTSCVVYTPGTPASDGLGGLTPGTPTSATTVCRIAATGGQEAEISAKVTALETFTVTLPYNTTLTAASWIVAGGATYEIKAVLSAATNLTALRVLATRKAG